MSSEVDKIASRIERAIRHLHRLSANAPRFYEDEFPTTEAAMREMAEEAKAVHQDMEAPMEHVRELFQAYEEAFFALDGAETTAQSGRYDSVAISVFDLGQVINRLTQRIYRLDTEAEQLRHCRSSPTPTQSPVFSGRATPSTTQGPTQGPDNTTPFATARRLVSVAPRPGPSHVGNDAAFYHDRAAWDSAIKQAQENDGTADQSVQLQPLDLSRGKSVTSAQSGSDFFPINGQNRQATAIGPFVGSAAGAYAGRHSAFNPLPAPTFPIGQPQSAATQAAFPPPPSVPMHFSQPAPPATATYAAVHPMDPATIAQIASVVAQVLQSTSSTRPAPHQPTIKPNTKLPKLSLLQFSGEYADFKPFYDNFHQNVHQQPSLSGADKLSYLRSCLSGKAAMLVSNLSLTNENYSVAMDALVKAFGNPTIAAETAMAKLYELKPVPRADKNRLKDFYFEMENLLQGLEALGVATDGAHMAGMLLKKLPYSVVSQMEREKGAQNPWSVRQLRQLLHREIELREASSRHAFGSDNLAQEREDERNKNSKFTKARGPTSTTESFASTEQRSNLRQRFPSQSCKNTNGYNPQVPSCAFCRQTHYSDQCAKVVTRAARLDKLRTAKCCFVCLRMDHQSKDCRNPKPCYHCKKVKMHHSSICPDRQYASTPHDSAHASIEDTGAILDLTPHSDVSSLAVDEKTVMKTAVVTIRNPEQPGNQMVVRAFFDSGTSRSFLTVRANQALQLRTTTEHTLSVKRFGGDDELPMLVPVKTALVELKALDGTRIRLSVAVSDKSVHRLSKVAIPQGVLDDLPDVQFADKPSPTNMPVEIDLMVGNDYYDDLIGPQQIDIRQGFRLIYSPFGWIMSGRLPDDDLDNAGHEATAALLLTERQPAVSMPQELEDLWRLETIGIRDEPSPVTDDDAVENFNRTVKFEDGRYQVTWPWKNLVNELPTNYMLALRRLQNMHKRMLGLNRIDYLQRYDKIIHEQVNRGITEIVHNANGGHRIHYLAHHGVETPDKATTKLRVVFDGSARESRGKPAINDCMHRGQIYLENLVHLLLRFRTFPIAITSDIEKAFLMVGLQHHDRDVTRFLWIKDIAKAPTEDNLMVLRFRRVCFGLVASPFLLGAAVLHHLKSDGSQIARKIADNVYVDNVITGVCSHDEAKRFYMDSKELFRRAGMNLREFSSNDAELIKEIPEADRVTEDVTKVLGVVWDRKSDSLSIRVPKQMSDPPTKRSILSELFQVYDPLGFAVPVTIRGRLLLQRVTKGKRGWNAKLDDGDASAWRQLWNDLQKLQNVTVQRFYGGNAVEVARIMAFCDASTQAYATVVYVQMQKADGTYESKLAFAKARVSPLKQMSIPRLELLALLIAVRSVVFVRDGLHFSGRTVIWSDSQCVLWWIHSMRVQGTFIENRLKEIRAAKGIEFRYVPTKDNPADRASRGCCVDQLDATWFRGPKWASKSDEYWPSVVLEPKQSDGSGTTCEYVQPAISIRVDSTPFGLDENRFSSLMKLLRCTAYCMRIQDRIRKLPLPASISIQAEEIERAASLWIKFVQRKHFSDIRKAIKEGKTSSTKVNLGVVLDDNGILRCHGRLANMATDDDAKFPVLLPTKSKFTEHVVRHCHAKNLHAGVAQTLSAIRCGYWIPKGRACVKYILRRCAICQKIDGGPFRRPNMPDLPPERVRRNRPFAHVGLDYFGPLYVRSQTSMKR